MHDQQLHEGALWACQRDQAPNEYMTAFDEECGKCMAIFMALTRQGHKDENGEAQAVGVVHFKDDQGQIFNDVDEFLDNL